MCVTLPPLAVAAAVIAPIFPAVSASVAAAVIAPTIPVVEVVAAAAGTVHGLVGGTLWGMRKRISRNILRRPEM